MQGQRPVFSMIFKDTTDCAKTVIDALIFVSTHNKPYITPSIRPKIANLQGLPYNSGPTLEL